MLWPVRFINGGIGIRDAVTAATGPNVSSSKAGIP
jgi:hypothetical protein